MAGGLHAQLYSRMLPDADALATYALVHFTFVANLAPQMLSTVFPHEMVAHIRQLGTIPVAPIFLSDERGEALLSFVKQVLRSGSNDWTLHTAQVLEWWRGRRRGEEQRRCHATAVR